MAAKLTSTELDAREILPFRKKPVTLARALENHFLLGSAMIISAAGAAEAEIVHGSLSGVLVPVDDNLGLFLDLDTGAFSIGSTMAGYDINLFEQVGTQLLQARLPANGVDGTEGFSISPYTYVRALPSGAVIGPAAAPFVPYGILAAVDSGGDHGDFANGGSDLYLGLRFSSASNQTVYGWLRLTVQPALTPDGAGDVASVVEYAFDTTGAPIAVGQIPEPDSLGYLALGAVGVAAYKRWLRQQEDSEEENASPATI